MNLNIDCQFWTPWRIYASRMLHRLSMEDLILSGMFRYLTTEKNQCYIHLKMWIKTSFVFFVSSTHLMDKHLLLLVRMEIFRYAAAQYPYLIIQCKMIFCSFYSSDEGIEVLFIQQLINLSLSCKPRVYYYFYIEDCMVEIIFLCLQ